MFGHVRQLETPVTVKPRSPNATTGTGTGTKAVTGRLIVRRTRLTDTQQLKLWPDWRHHAFLTDLDGDAVGDQRKSRSAISESRGRGHVFVLSV